MLDKLIKTTAIIFFLLFPLFYLPIGNTSADFDKQILLLVFTAVITVLLVVEDVFEKKISFVSTSFDLLILALCGLYLISNIFMAPNRINTLILPMGSGTVFALTLLYFICTRLFAKEEAAGYIKTAVISAVILAVLNIFTYFNKTFTFYPLGGSYQTAIFLLPFIFYLILNMKSRSNLKGVKGLISVMTFIIIVGGGALSFYRLFTDQKPLLLPWYAGWSIMMEAYKNMVNFLFGVGPNNFSHAFALGKPIELNNTAFWNIAPNLSSSYLLTVATEAGVIAASVFVLIAVKVLRLFSARQTRFAYLIYLIPLTVIFTILIILPVNLPFLILAVIFLAAAAPKQLKQHALPFSQKTAVIISLAAIALFAVILYWPARSYAGDIWYRKSLTATRENKLGDALNFIQTAVYLNPYSEQSLALASTLSVEAARSVSRASAQSSDSQIASTSAEMITTLAQQAIDQAKKTVELNSQKSENWLLLADTYQAFIGTRQTAEKEALEAYLQQIRLDPLSPQAKVAAGGILMSQGDYENAVWLFKQAINLKPDWNNAHYNLGILYASVQNYPQALDELQKTIAFTPSDSPDYAKIQQTMQSLLKLQSGLLEATPSTQLKTDKTASPSAKSAK